QPPSAHAHVIDGQFTGDEWAHAERLEGMLTDVYFDYQAPYLFMLNDWRANSEGIRPECYNQFNLKIGCYRIDLKVYGDGHIEVSDSYAGEGAFAVATSPHWAVAHAIWEFALEVPDGQVDVGCMDPVNMWNCEQLTAEPVMFSIQVDHNISGI